MDINDVIYLWNKSKYKTIMIQSLPCVNHKGEITHGTGLYNKGQTILCGGEYKVEDYLKKVYSGLFMFEYVKDDYIVFKEICRRYR